MAGQIMCRLYGSRTTLRFRRLKTLYEKFVGLLGSDRWALPVVLCGCSSVHTVGMRYALDVALVARNGLVLKVRRNLPPWRVVYARGAYYALERPTSDAPWPREGGLVGIAECPHRRGSAGMRNTTKMEVGA